MDQNPIIKEDEISSEAQTSSNIYQVGQVNVINEGKAKIFVKTFEPKPGGELQEQEVFYNPVQVFNRDLTILVINEYAKRIKFKNFKREPENLIILEALAATGLRSIRFLKELDCIHKIHINDLSKSAIESIKKNIELNGLDLQKIQIENDDAIDLMYKARCEHIQNGQQYKYDVIDLDPYGSAIPFLDSAIQAVRDGGLICATFTDLRVLSGPDVYKCFYQYGVSRQKMICHQENAIRTILYSISNIANKHSRYIQPQLSYQSEFYARVFFTVHNGRKECAKSLAKTGIVYYCDECTNYHVQPFGELDKSNKTETLTTNKIKFNFSICDQCGSHLGMNGPVWIDQINNISFIQSIRDEIDQLPNDTGISTQKKITGTLHGILMEGDTGKSPYSFQMSRVAKFLKARLPPQKQLVIGMKSLGYHLESSYFAPDQCKTNASGQIVFDLIKSWIARAIRLYPSQLSMIYIPKIWVKLSRFKPNFDFQTDDKKKEKIARFMPNPDKNWGPKKRANNKQSTQNLQEEDNHNTNSMIYDTQLDVNKNISIQQVNEDEKDIIIKKQKILD